jgi:hypothetical protein
MFMLKREGPKIYWTLDGEHIFYIQTLPNEKTGKNKKAMDTLKGKEGIT